MNPPYGIELMDTAGRVLSRGRPDLDGVPPAANGVGAPLFRTLAVMPLDCGQILQMLTDLRSDTRLVVVFDHDAGEFRPIRTMRIEKPIGFVASDTGLKQILAASDEGSLRRVALLQWQ